MDSETKEFLKGLLKSALSIAVDVGARIGAEYLADKAKGVADVKLQDMKKNKEWKKAFNSGDVNNVKAWLDKYKG